MVVYHCTRHADAIFHDGFRDTTGTYMTREQWTGVWVSDEPLDEREGARGDVVLALHIPDPLFVQYEWVEEGKPYREALIPAADLNHYRPILRLVTEHELDEVTCHSLRFRQVSDRYPRRVTEAYDHDQARAMTDTDEQVAASVAAWEREHGMQQRNWHAIGTSEGRDPARLPSSRLWDAL